MSASDPSATSACPRVPVTEVPWRTTKELVLTARIAAGDVTLAGNFKVYGMLYSPDQQFFFSKTEFVNYRVIGNGEKAVIFLHGFGASNRTWDDIVPHLNLPNTSFILFDLIGAGFSSKPRRADYSMRANALVIESFIREYDLRGYALVGHSFGGGVSLLATLEFLESAAHRPSALVLLDAAAYETKLPFFVEDLRVPLLGNVLLAVTPYDFQARNTLEKLYFDKAKVTQDKVERYSFFMSIKGYNNALIETARQIKLEDFSRYSEQYKDITIPTLVLWGRQDTAVPLEDGRKLSKDIPTAKLVIIEDSGHNIQEEQPKGVARLINGFLGDVWGCTASKRGP
jgi:pimeloyl-ACP methyl ester carboxylesterase